MGFGGAGSPATPPLPLPPPAAHPPTLASVLSKPIKADSGKMTADNSIATSPQGLKTPPPVAKTTLLGQ